MSQPVITMLSDFGIQDGYTACMKGVILTICPDARLVDISHLINPQSVSSGAFVLYTCYEYFPNGTIHLAVVDPGVGTERNAIAIRTSSYFFVGPDNGIFSFVLRKEAGWLARRLENPQLRRSPLSCTFHGRDLFAPVAAHLACGISFEALGPACDPIFPDWREPLVRNGEVKGEVIHIDRFGNAIVNVPAEILEKQATARSWSVVVENFVINSISQTYGQAEAGKALALTGSSGFIEIAVNQGNAASQLGLCLGTRVAFRVTTSA